MIITNVIVAVVFGFIIAAFSYYLRFLTKGGAVATFFLAVIIYGVGTWQWTIPILTFFILSSLLSKLRLKKNHMIENVFEKTSVRDAYQVMVNGGLGGILAIFYFIWKDDLFYIIYVGTIAAVCADTWETEIGTLRKTTTYNILTFKTVEQGISGGVSIMGTAGGLVGAFLISLSGSFWINESKSVVLFLIVLSGFLASLLDSILGAALQVQYKCKICNKIVERKNHCGIKTNFYKGIKWFNNDLVNLAAAFSGGCFVLILYKVII